MTLRARWCASALFAWTLLAWPRVPGCLSPGSRLGGSLVLGSNLGRALLVAALPLVRILRHEWSRLILWEFLTDFSG
jgi:hypothetical protein